MMMERDVAKPFNTLSAYLTTTATICQRRRGKIKDRALSFEKGSVDQSACGLQDDDGPHVVVVAGEPSPLEELIHVPRVTGHLKQAATHRHNQEKA